MSTNQQLSRLGWPLANCALEALQPLVLVLAFQLGTGHLVRGHNPINFCNGLLFGNAFSLVTLLVLRWLRPRPSNDRRGWQWGDLRRVLLPVGSNALLEVALVIALSRIAAVQVAVVLALGVVVLLVLGCIREQRWPMPLALLGAALVVGAAQLSIPPQQGVAMMTTMSPMGEALVANTVTGNGLLLLGVLVLSTVTLISSEPVARDLDAVDYGIWQCLLQTIIFLIWAITTYGFSHLYDLQSPLLWQMMLLYGAGVSTLYTLCENVALARSGPLLLSLFEGLLPLFSGLFALGLLGEAFSSNLLVSALVTAIGIACIELG